MIVYCSAVCTSYLLTLTSWESPWALKLPATSDVSGRIAPFPWGCVVGIPFYLHHNMFRAAPGSLPKHPGVPSIYQKIKQSFHFVKRIKDIFLLVLFPLFLPVFIWHFTFLRPYAKHGPLPDSRRGQCPADITLASNWRLNSISMV